QDSAGLLVDSIYRGISGRVDSTHSKSKALTRFLIQGTSWDTVPSRTRRVDNTYDAEGNLIGVYRGTINGGIMLGANVNTTWSYDAARRVRRRVEGNVTDSMYYDPSGLLTTKVSGRGLRIRHGYDALGRLQYR